MCARRPTSAMLKRCLLLWTRFLLFHCGNVTSFGVMKMLAGWNEVMVDKKCSPIRGIIGKKETINISFGELSNWKSKGNDKECTRHSNQGHGKNMCIFLNGKRVQQRGTDMGGLGPTCQAQQTKCGKHAISPNCQESFLGRSPCCCMCCWKRGVCLQAFILTHLCLIALRLSWLVN